MAEPSPSPPSNNYLGLGGICKAYKSVFSRRNQNKNPSHLKVERENRFKSMDDIAYVDSADKALNEERSLHGEHSGDGFLSPRNFTKHRSVDNSFTSFSAPLSSSRTPSPRESPAFLRSMSRRSTTPTPRGSPSLSRNMSKRSPTLTPNAASTPPKSMNWRAMEVPSPVASLSRSASRMSPGTPTPILFSNSDGFIKTPAVEKRLECKLEELCFGSVKKIKITRDVVTDYGEIIQEEEMLTIEVKPGWKKGTKITFEGMGNETPGAPPADITFVISEKRHPMFRREGDDLELLVEVPLVKALSGCTLSVPLLGGEKMSLTMNDIIHPGYEKIIAGQGMLKPKEQGKRGNLILKFLIEFPTDLTEEQRSEVYNILQDAC